MVFMARLFFGVVWSLALVLSITLFTLSSSWGSRMLFAVAALVAVRHVLYGPIHSPQRERQR